MQKNKNDAHGLAQIVNAGWYREVGVKNLERLGYASSVLFGRSC